MFWIGQRLVPWTTRSVLISINTHWLNCESGGSRAAAPLSVRARNSHSQYSPSRFFEKLPKILAPFNSRVTLRQPNPYQLHLKVLYVYHLIPTSRYCGITLGRAEILYLIDCCLFAVSYKWHSRCSNIVMNETGYWKSVIIYMDGHNGLKHGPSSINVQKHDNETTACQQGTP